MGVEQVVSEASKQLISKTFGGVSKESAMAAIKAATEKMAKAGEEAVAKITQELQAYKGKSAQEMADLTSKNDRVILETKAEAKAAVEAAKKQAAEQLKAARAPKVFEKALPNGGKEVRKVSANGATMVKEYNADGKLLKYSVTQLDGSIRRTTFDPITGKPVKTFTNIGGDKLVWYKDGNSSITKAVNKKKVKAQKPTLVSQTDPKRIFYSDYGREAGYEITRTYSDGSKEVVQKFTETNNKRTIVRKLNAQNVQTEEKITWENGSEKINRYNPDKKTHEYVEVIKLKNGLKLKTANSTVNLPNDGIATITGCEYAIGNAKLTATRIKDEYGLYTDKYRIKVTFPKETGKKPLVINEGTEGQINNLQNKIYSYFGNV